MESKQQFISTVKTDLEAILSSPVMIDELDETCLDTKWLDDYDCIDDIQTEFNHYQPEPDLLVKSENIVSERLRSDLFKTNCMVTGQPDWASIFISYRGPEIERTGLLRYLVSFRDHQAFHEPSCEMIFSDLLERCSCEELSVYCRYTRRGGIDINPYRSTSDELPDNYRILRQ